MRTELGIVISVRGSRATDEKKRQFLEELRRSKTGRLSADQLGLLLYGSQDENAKRKVRRVAAALRPQVLSFPGSDGYALWRRCPVDEIWHAIYEMEAAAATIIKDAASLRRALHSGYRGEAEDQEKTCELKF